MPSLLSSSTASVANIDEMNSHLNSDTRISQLAKLIYSNTTKLDQYLNSRNLPSPSFDVDGPVDFGISLADRHVEEARIEAIESGMELIDLLQGPVALIRPFGVHLSRKVVEIAC